MLNSLKIEEILVGLILFSLPISIAFNSILITLIAIYFIVETIKDGNFLELKKYYVSLLFFIVQLVSFLLSNNKDQASPQLLLFSSFILLPIIFSYLSQKKIIINQIKVFNFLFYGTLLILFYGSLRFVLDVTLYSVRYDYGRAVALILKYIPHHVYLSIFILVSIYTKFIDELKNKFNWKNIFLMLVMYLYLILLGSRMAIFISISIMPFFLFNTLKNNKNKKKILFSILIFGLIVFTIGLSNNYVRDKIIYTYYDFFGIQTDEKPFSGVSYRLQTWKSAITLISESPYFGYTIGDVQYALDNTYQNVKLKGLNAHNQFFQFLLNYGVVLSLPLFFLVGSIIRKIRHLKENLILFAWVSVLFFGLTESILNRQWGLVIFAFILNFAIYFNVLKKA